MSCFVDLALKRRCVVNVIGRETGGSRDDACVFYSEVDEARLFACGEKLIFARLWRARDIVPFV